MVSGFVNGRPVDDASEGSIDVVDPSDGSIVETVGLMGASDVGVAVEAATAAFPGWAATTPAERGGALLALARRLVGA